MTAPPPSPAPPSPPPPCPPDALDALTEVFRRHGYEGATMQRITAATGLGKGSLYRYFPGGKEEMMARVLDHVAGWFRAEIFAPLQDGPPAAALAAMVAATRAYFHRGGRVCLIGALALDDHRDRFAAQIAPWFADWIAALAATLRRGGLPPAAAEARAAALVAGIQGALVLSRALDDPAVFDARLAALEAQAQAALGAI